MQRIAVDLSPVEAVENDMPRIITVDGQPGSGKTTLATRIAEEFGYQPVTAGMVYCGIAAALEDAGLTHADATTRSDFALDATISFDVSNPHETSLAVNGQDYIGTRLFSPRNKNLSQYVGALPGIGKKFDLFYRQLAQTGKWVFDRGQSVFPDADLRIWLEAPVATRVVRRCAQYALEGSFVSYEQLLVQTLTREQRDKRSTSYSRRPDVTVINTAHLDIEGTVQAAAKHILPASS